MIVLLFLNTGTWLCIVYDILIEHEWCNQRQVSFFSWSFLTIITTWSNSHDYVYQQHVGQIHITCYNMSVNNILYLFSENKLRNQYLHTCEKMLTQLMQMMIEISELVDNSSSYPNFSNNIWQSCLSCLISCSLLVEFQIT